jgi:hypothetical protein
VYIVSERTEQEIRERLTRADVDVAAAIVSGKLALMNQREIYLQDGGFNPDRMIEFLHTTEEATLNASSFPAAARMQSVNTIARVSRRI